ncbi:hypothetical protein K523DRAFT_323644 [Schizophyllum commune Tattone D]|nr:hypothetical protein K523DRAFT_323644 [Schizophyllum commune Tattone D]
MPVVISINKDEGAAVGADKGWAVEGRSSADDADQTPRPSRSFSERFSMSSHASKSSANSAASSAYSATSSAYSASVGYAAAAGYTATPTLPTIADTSMEMQLDSLHFDDLSFDVDNFLEGVN